MTAKRRMPVLVGLLLSAILYLQPQLLKAQTDSLAFEQGRLRIWCETARFVYDDNEADSLLPSINCQSWEALKTSLRATDAQLGVMRLMNSVDKPAIYTGYAGKDKKLQKLAEEITKRLKDSPVRANNPQRLQNVDALAAQLLLIAHQSGLQAQTTPAPAGSTVEPEAEMEDDAYLDPPGEPVVMEPKSSLPWNEILQWLALAALAGYVFWRMQKQEARYKYLKSEFRKLEQDYSSMLLERASATDAVAAKDELRVREIAEEVVEEAVRSGSSSAMPPQTATSVPQQPVPAEAKQAPATTQASAPPLAGPAGKTTTAPGAVVSASDHSNEAQSAETESEEDAALAATESTGLFYDKMPFRGGFHQNELSRERQRDSLYIIRPFQDQPGEAEFWISEDPDIQRYAMQNGLSFFEEGCEFTEVDENPSRVVNEQKGRLRKEGAVWKILRKALVRFE